MGNRRKSWSIGVGAAVGLVLETWTAIAAQTPAATPPSAPCTAGENGQGNGSVVGIGNGSGNAGNGDGVGNGQGDAQVIDRGNGGCGGGAKAARHQDPHLDVSVRPDGSRLGIRITVRVTR